MRIGRTELRQAVVSLLQAREYAQKREERAQEDRAWRDVTLPEREQKLIKMIQNSQFRQVIYEGTVYSVAEGPLEKEYTLREESSDTMILG